MKRHGNFRDVSGQRFGLLTVSHFLRRENGSSYYRCVCDCGEKKTVSRCSLSNGRVRSCGCLRRKIAREVHLTHGGTYTKEYVIWSGMKKRCFNPRSPAFKYYGSRGITMCDEWRGSFERFYLDMGPKPNGKSIDRIDNDGNYEPGNCRWATTSQQNANRRKLK